MPRSSLLLLLPLVVAVPRLAAAQSAAPVWHVLVQTADGTRLSVDSTSVLRTSGSIWRVRTGTWYPAPLAVEAGNVDREVDTEELDCANARSRGIEAALYLGENRVMVRALDNQWASVPETRRPVVDVICGYLSTAKQPGWAEGYELDAVEQQPRLINVSSVQQALSSEYPASLRDAGVTGTVTIRFRIMQDGRVDPASTRAEHATHPDFETAALRVVYMMRFQPARVHGRPVRVWVTLPVTFQVISGNPPGQDAVARDTYGRPSSIQLRGPPKTP